MGYPQECMLPKPIKRERREKREKRKFNDKENLDNWDTFFVVVSRKNAQTGKN